MQRTPGTAQPRRASPLCCQGSVIPEDTSGRSDRPGSLVFCLGDGGGRAEGPACSQLARGVLAPRLDFSLSCFLQPGPEPAAPSPTPYTERMKGRKITPQPLLLQGKLRKGWTEPCQRLHKNSSVKRGVGSGFAVLPGHCEQTRYGKGSLFLPPRGSTGLS